MTQGTNQEPENTRTHAGSHDSARDGYPRERTPNLCEFPCVLGLPGHRLLNGRDGIRRIAPLKPSKLAGSCFARIEESLAAP